MDPTPGGLGRHVPPDWAHLDRYPMRPVLEALQAPVQGAKAWDIPLAYDQGRLPACPGFSAAQVMTAVTLAATGKAVAFDALRIYQWANAHDGMAQPHDGSTVRAAFDCLTQVGAAEFANGADTGPVDKLKSYVWTQDVDDVIRAVLSTGPVDLGITWYSAMNFPDGEGRIRVAGDALGGHAVALRAVDTSANMAIIKNQWASWGKPSADPGDALISLDDLATLLSRDGEACLANWR